MKTTFGWIKDYVDIEDIDVKEFVEKMTTSGSKVEKVEFLGQEIDKIVVGKILKLEKHPDADKLQVSKIDIGSEVIQVVTGAQNVKVGDFVPVALIGAKLPGGVEIKKGKLRGVDSFGMMCSINELNLLKEDYPQAAEDGIFILKDNLPLGEDVKKIFGIDGVVIEFEITSNRTDCFSVLGLAREAAVIFNRKLKKPEVKINEIEEDVRNHIKVNVLDNEICKRYTARVIKDVKVSQSPKWMKDRLRGAGIRPINNIVDITNFVMLEFGQPMHAFDLKKIAGNELIIRKALQQEKIITLDENEKILTDEMLVIADKQKALAIAGIMGGQSSEIENDTVDIVLECANFESSAIRITSKNLGMRTESSSLFEKGLNLENTVIAINRAAQLIEELAGGKVCRGNIDIFKEELKTREIKLNSEKINKLLGTQISEQYMLDVFKKLEFGVDEERKILQIPSFRSDIEQDADLAEEIARIYGYNNIKATLLRNANSTIGGRTRAQKIVEIIKNVLNSNGLFEILTYTFTGPKVFDKLMLPEESELRNAIRISNPLGEDYSIMRTTMIPEMLNALSLNFNRRNEEAHLFEISKVFIKKGEKDILPYEKEVVGIGMYGNQVDFYNLKGIVDSIFEQLKIKKYEYRTCTDNGIFHPGRCANIFVNEKHIGVIGEVHPKVSENFQCHNRTYIGTLELEGIIENSPSRESYKQLPKFPSVERDISMIVEKDIMVQQIEDIIKQRGGAILEGVKLFDVYTGQQVGDGMKSVAYSLSFRSQEKTLTDEDVNKSMVKIVNGLKTKLGANLRD